MTNTVNKITLLDCTLRDGGYMNDWRFGKDAIQKIVPLIAQTGVSYIELGFMKTDEYQLERAIFNDIYQITELLQPFPANTKLAVMVETGHGYSVDLFPERSDKTPALVRLMTWKRMIPEAFEYCRALLRKGYEVCMQPTRVEQYSENDFIELISVFNKINIRGLYIVDTFGLLDKNMLLKYANLAEKHLKKNIAIGYHAHNNMQQAFANAQAFADMETIHDKMIDISCFGIGRCAGNLCSELFMRYLNNTCGAHYNIASLLELADKYILPIYHKQPWGYALPYYLSAINGINPEYASYVQNKGLSTQTIAGIFEEMHRRESGIIYDTDEIERFIKEASA